MHDDARGRRIDLTRDRLGLGGIAAVDDDRTALRDEPGRGLFAHARTTAGDDRNLIQEPLHLPIGRLTKTTNKPGTLARQCLSIDRDILSRQ
jgi:hypothetical protein